jgi:hypothetical protein
MEREEVEERQWRFRRGERVEGGGGGEREEVEGRGRRRRARRGKRGRWRRRRERREGRGEEVTSVEGLGYQSIPWLAPSHTWSGWPSGSTDWLSSPSGTPAGQTARLRGARET